MNITNIKITAGIKNQNIIPGTLSDIDGFLEALQGYILEAAENLHRKEESHPA
ncbi:hypothetical protein LY28_01313 [Ruminiclostridium sufflavum DSM 19573]|uniref:Uncharacterized protein n=1 Tax=Ruminiclostridium sufflavum DSM 19573 TaxID=1121337 RepID=A0A318Y8A2_9FIRM|nr:hypothetical protein [Ruminiclostridium sufflavum]PYG88464.1 hypothetical protein LY28_01313 [Ruminiclostridium sufflavum DSM 19573]